MTSHSIARGNPGGAQIDGDAERLLFSCRWCFTRQKGFYPVPRTVCINAVLNEHLNMYSAVKHKISPVVSSSCTNNYRLYIKKNTSAVPLRFYSELFFLLLLLLLLNKS